MARRGSVSERLAERLAEVFAEVLGEDEDREISADDVSGLDERIDERIAEQEIDADDITGLERLVENTIDDKVGDCVREWCDDANWGEKLDSDIHEAVEHEVDAKLPEAIALALAERPAQAPVDVAALLATPEAQAALQTEVRKALVNVLHGLVANLFPVAQPVEQR